METMRSTQPSVLLSETEFNVKSEDYGWGKSIHNGWIQHYYHQHTESEGWPVEAEIFLQKVGGLFTEQPSKGLCRVTPWRYRGRAFPESCRKHGYGQCAV